MSKEKQKRADGFEQIEEATISTEQFIEKNQKLLVRGVLVIIIVVGAILGYYRFYKAPMEQEALKQMFVAENLFEKNSFNMALNGDGNAPGFLEIIDKYSSTPSGNLANYYAGICYLHLGDIQNAIKHLEKFSSDDVIFSSMVTANLGDAYMQLGDFKKASSYYQKATTGTTNMATTPVIMMKTGLAFEKANDYKSALNMYERLEKEFPASYEARDIEKYITRAKLNMK